MADPLTDKPLQSYKKTYRCFKLFENENLVMLDDAVKTNEEAVPNLMQQEAIERLSNLREHGENKALVIAATIPLP